MNLLSNCSLSIIIVVFSIITAIIIAVLIITTNDNENATEQFGNSESNFMNFLDFSIAGLKLNKKNDLLLQNLIAFRDWISRNQEDKIVLNADPAGNMGYIVDKFLRETNDIKFTDAVILKDILNSYFSEDTEKFTPSAPSRIIQFTDWLNEDLPRRKRFDLALTASAKDYNKFYISSFINEFRGYKKIPMDELKTLKEDIIKYLDSNNKAGFYDVTFNTTQFDKLRTIFRNNPQSSTKDKLNLYYKIYAGDPLGQEIDNFIRYLNTIQVLNKINSITNKNIVDKESARTTFNKIMDEYPNKTPLLRKAICVQFVDMVYN